MSRLPKVRILYKLILKLHRGLPEEFQVIGTNYARDEFKRHRTCNPQEADIFMKEWTNYAISLAKQLGIKGVEAHNELGDKTTSELVDHLRDEQIVQLYELMEAARAPKESKIDQER